tara:strand:+ start:3407 stop:4618 length:1212 start_codon:yes stop_codon:yes gene_type:complete
MPPPSAGQAAPTQGPPAQAAPTQGPPASAGKPNLGVSQQGGIAGAQGLEDYYNIGREFLDKELINRGFGQYASRGPVPMPASSPMPTRRSPNSGILNTGDSVLGQLIQPFATVVDPTTEIGAAAWAAAAAAAVGGEGRDMGQAAQMALQAHRSQSERDYRDSLTRWEHKEREKRIRAEEANQIAKWNEDDILQKANIGMKLASSQHEQGKRALLTPVDIQNMRLRVQALQNSPNWRNIRGQTTQGQGLLEQAYRQIDVWDEAIRSGRAPLAHQSENKLNTMLGRNISQDIYDDDEDNSVLARFFGGDEANQRQADISRIEVEKQGPMYAGFTDNGVTVLNTMIRDEKILNWINSQGGYSKEDKFEIAMDFIESIEAQNGLAIGQAEKGNIAAKFVEIIEQAQD